MADKERGGGSGQGSGRAAERALGWARGLEGGTGAAAAGGAAGARRRRPWRLGRRRAEATAGRKPASGGGCEGHVPDGWTRQGLAAVALRLHCTKRASAMTSAGTGTGSAAGRLRGRRTAVWAQQGSGARGAVSGQFARHPGAVMSGF